MPDFPTLVTLVGTPAAVVAALAVMVYLVLKPGVDDAVKSAVRDIDWPRALSQELEKTRGTERQEWRFKCYGALWGKLSPLAIYGTQRFSRQDAATLSAQLTAWYFQESGGLLLTRQAGEYYFALQDLLRITTRLDADWSADGTAMLYRDPEKIMGPLVPAGAVPAWDYFQARQFATWREQAAPHGKLWKDGIAELGNRWPTLSETERFAVLQQVGSILRTALVNDLESRLP